MKSTEEVLRKREVVMRTVMVPIFFPVKVTVKGGRPSETISLVEPEGISLPGFAWHMLKVFFFLFTIMLAVPLDELGKSLGRWRVRLESHVG